MAKDDSPKSGDLPPYPDMILAAIEALGDKNGSNKTAISTYIEENYENLPSAHASLLTANLASMKEGGKLAFVKNNYLKPDAAAEPTPKRGRGRPRKDPNAPPPPPKAPKDPSAPKRGRGRPPKAAKATPAAKKAKVVKEAKPAPAADASGSAPAKRGRGRPPKAK